MSTIELSPRTLEILKNYVQINPSLLIRKGNNIETVAISSEIMSISNIAEEFPTDIAIYDLGKFLNQLKLFSKPAITIDEQNRCMSIRDTDPERQDASCRWMFADPSVIRSPKRMLPAPTPDVHFMMPASKLEALIKAANILGFKHIQVSRNDDTSIKITVIDMDMVEGTHYRVVLPATFNEEFTDVVAYWSIENLKVIIQDYSIALSRKLYSHIYAQDIQYFIAIEKQSSFKTR